nr:TfuA-like protein [Polymorphobacter sp.]
MMAPVVFAGPSLLRPAPGFVLRPPAAAGDLLAFAAGAPRALVLIDGVFDGQPAVQHKEILALLARGFRVIGGASMGALRAAELHRFGMEGVGAVFAGYASGRITADDEVAVLHAPAALGHRALTEALVDIRATLAAAAAARVIQVGLARALRDAARATFWREREWPALLAIAAALDGEGGARLTAWLPKGRVRLKARDAELCLAAALRPVQLPVRLVPPRTRYFQGLAVLNGIRL